MTSEAWEKRLGNLIKKYKASADVASFRNDYRDIVARATEGKKITKAEADLLLQARDFLESWASLTPPDLGAAYGQWSKLYDGGKHAIPSPILEAFLRRFPQAKVGSLNWEPFVLSCLNPALVYALLDRKLATEHDLNHIAQLKPAEFYASAALDVLAERKALKDPRPLWDECIRGSPRPPGLLPREELLISCYSASPGDKESELMLTYLLDTCSDREKLFDLLLREREAATRFCRFLTLGQPSVAMRSAAWIEARIQEILIAWVARCAVQLSKAAGPTADTASLVLAHIRLSAVSAPTEETEDHGQIGKDAAKATQASLLHALQRLEETRSSREGNSVLVILARELYQAVQGYLHRLHIGANSGQASPERALRFERHQGSMQVIEQVLLALEETPDDTGLRDALEVAMFNCGVRSLEETGKEVRFDAHLHEAETPGVLPDDLVIVTNPGRSLGAVEERLVLVKAKTRPAQN